MFIHVRGLTASAAELEGRLISMLKIVDSSLISLGYVLFGKIHARTHASTHTADELLRTNSYNTR